MDNGLDSQLPRHGDRGENCDPQKGPQPGADVGQPLHRRYTLLLVMAWGAMLSATATGTLFIHSCELFRRLNVETATALAAGAVSAALLAGFGLLAWRMTRAPH